ncbi:hypothetical protein D3C81_1108540 [compost metagenome]
MRVVFDTGICPLVRAHPVNTSPPLNDVSTHVFALPPARRATENLSAWRKRLQSTVNGDPGVITHAAGPVVVAALRLVFLVVQGTKRWVLSPTIGSITVTFLSLIGTEKNSHCAVLAPSTDRALRCWGKQPKHADTCE